MDPRLRGDDSMRRPLSIVISAPTVVIPTKVGIQQPRRAPPNSVVTLQQLSQKNIVWGGLGVAGWVLVVMMGLCLFA